MTRAQRLISDCVRKLIRMTKSSPIVQNESSRESLPDREFVTALARGIDVLNAFSSEYPEMTLSQVSMRTGLSAATVRRSLITFEQLGYVRREGRNFLLSPKVLTLGTNYLRVGRDSCKTQQKRP